MKLNNKEIQAIQDTINHWEKDIRSNLLKGLNISVSRNGLLRWKNRKTVNCYAKDFAMCQISLKPDKTLNCSICPYYRYHGETCDDRDSQWFAFATNPCLETCENMITSLNELLEQNLKKELPMCTCKLGGTLVHLN
jgi:hypothetical protein